MRLPRMPLTLQPATAPSIGQPGAGEAVGSVGANDRVIVPGEVFWTDGQTHDVDVLHWRTGNASTPSFTLRSGLRNLDLTAGPAGRDDGTEDGNSGTHVNPAGTTNFSTTLATPRTVAHGERLAWVLDLTAWVSGNVRAPAGLTAQANEHGSFGTYYNGTTYALISQPLIPLLTLEAIEGGSSVFGVFLPGMPRFTAAPASLSFNSGSAADEESLAFTLVQPAKRIQWGWFLTTVSGGSFDVVLYLGTTALATKTFDANTWGADAVARWVEGTFAGSFAAGTYRLALKPASGTNVTITTVAMTAGHLATVGGTSADHAYLLGRSNRVDAGAWSTPDDTSLPFPAFVDIEPAAASGGDGGARSLFNAGIN